MEMTVRMMTTIQVLTVNGFELNHIPCVLCKFQQAKAILNIRKGLSIVPNSTAIHMRQYHRNSVRIGTLPKMYTESQPSSSFSIPSPNAANITDKKEKDGARVPKVSHYFTIPMP